MKERINRLAKGIIDSDLPEMVWEPEVIEETIKIYTTARRELFIGSRNGLNVKGLVYSTSARVRISRDNNAFGGLRNHIFYEVDSSFLSAGDEIKGSFYLVTNCGEQEIPYIFHVELASSGKVLGNLNTADDFLNIAEHDMETALRLLEYQDFTEAPFMQDMHTRAIFDGLKGYGSRQSLMEEFLVALKLKSPISLIIDTDKKVYENPSEHLEDSISVCTDTWGFVYMEISSEEEFIHLPKKNATQADFQNGEMKIPFCILTERLHAGRNLGSIVLTTAGNKTSIPLEVLVNHGLRSEEQSMYKEEMARYLELRLDYETGIYEADIILNQMQRGLDLMKMTYHDPSLALLQAEVDMLAGRIDKACLILDECRDTILRIRIERKDLYAFYQYLQISLHRDAEQKDSFIRLLQKFCSAEERDRGSYVFYLLLLKVNEEIFKNPATVLISMEQEFKGGCHSPFLYAECLKLLEKDPEISRNLNGVILQSLYFGIRKGMMGRELALHTARMMKGTRSYKELYLRLLMRIYENFREPEVLEAVCIMMIRGDQRSGGCFSWYEAGVDAGISLTRLNEYYLYSLPEDYGKCLPKEILLYFSYASDLDAESRSLLYANILEYVDRSTELYRLYEREIEKFAMEQLFAGRINGRLAVIYKHMLYVDLIDRQIAKTLPSVLRSNRIACRDAAMKYVVVRHEELVTEDAYLLNDGVAYVPLFSERDVILFQDQSGSRYLNIRYDQVPAMDQVDDLLKQCFKVSPEDAVLFVNACHEIMDKGNMTREEATLLEKADEKMRLHPLFIKKLTSSIVHYYKNLADGGEDGERDESVAYLLCVDKDTLTREERGGVCETLIRQNYYTESYSMICRYGTEGILPGRLLKLCTKMVLQKLFDEDDRLLHLAYEVFLVEQNDSVILDYLCEHFNGTVEQMYQVLMQGIHGRVETYDLEERLVAQMLFTGNTVKMDRVFELYASRKKTNESIVRAYFTIKSMEYFLYGKSTGDRVFSYLENAVNSSVEKDKVADIYLLALTKYYSTLNSLSGEQKELCKTVTDVLIEAGMLFAYFKDLAKFIPIPGNILDKEIIEYHGQKDSKPYLELCILPEEEEYHFEEMRPVYKGIYIREKVLFEGEILEYRITKEENGKKKTSEGSIFCKEVPARSRENRFACLNEMSLSLELKNEEALLKGMRDYLERDAVVAELFALL